MEDLKDSAVPVSGIDLAKLKGFKIIFNQKHNSRGDVKNRKTITYRDMVSTLIQKAKYEDIL